jgi:hypothetical protein
MTIKKARASAPNENPPNAAKKATLASFVERSQKYRGPGLNIPKRIKLKNGRPNPFDEGQNLHEDL